MDVSLLGFVLAFLAFVSISWGHFPVDAEVGDAPWQAYVQVNGTFRCGAALISPKWLITSAKCLDKYISWHTVVLGAIDKDTKQLGDPREYQVDKIIKEGNGADIAVIRIRRPAYLVEEPVMTIDPAKPGEFYGNMECVISGWGGLNGENRNTLQTMKVRVMTKKECTLPGPTPDDPESPKFGRRNQVCVVSEDAGSCVSDIGGPLACYWKYDKFGVHAEWKIVGTASYAMDDCKAGTPTVFMYVPYYHKNMIPKNPWG